jgi:hypothetical protein
MDHTYDKENSLGLGKGPVLLSQHEKCQTSDAKATSIRTGGGCHLAKMLAVSRSSALRSKPPLSKSLTFCLVLYVAA